MYNVEQTTDLLSGELVTVISFEDSEGNTWYIPSVETNADYQAYLKWKAEQ